MSAPITIEHEYTASPEEVWRLLTTREGIEAWAPPEGFAVTVRALEPTPGGAFVYDMTATGPAQVEFMRSAGLPLTNTTHKRFTELEPPRRLAYVSVVDFAPGVEPYEQLTVIELTPTQDGTHLSMTMDAMHDAEWTQRLTMGRRNELENLARLVSA